MTIRIITILWEEGQDLSINAENCHPWETLAALERGMVKTLAEVERDDGKVEALHEEWNDVTEEHIDHSSEDE